MNVEEIIKEAGTELLDHLKTETGADAREIQDLFTQIQEAFSYSLLVADPNAMSDLEARTKALMELTRITVVQEKKEVIRSSIMSAAKVTSKILMSL